MNTPRAGVRERSTRAGTPGSGPTRPGQADDARFQHRLRPMSGRDPHEDHRVSSPLELLFDLTFAVAFSVAGQQFAHLISNGHLHVAMVGFCFAMFSIIWAWINFTWFASAFDTDDWLFRLTTMVQMVGVIVLAIGLPAMFASLQAGDHFDIRVMVLGYVIMRVAMLLQWLRAWHACPERRPGIGVYIVTLTVAQVGWVALALAHLSVRGALLVGAALMLVEIMGPAIGERRSPTPWHAHHVAERYSLLALIALGEAVIGTVAALSASTDGTGTHWTLQSVLMAAAGIGVTFALWWVYFGLPFAELLHARRERSFVFGYLHMPLFAAIAAVGAGLHVASDYLQKAAAGQHHVPETTAVLALLMPVAVYIVTVYLLYFSIAGQFDWTHTLQFVAGMVLLVVAWFAARAGVELGWCLVLVALAPTCTAIGYEVVGHRHVAEAVRRVTASGAESEVTASGAE